MIPVLMSNDVTFPSTHSDTHSVNAYIITSSLKYGMHIIQVNRVRIAR